MQNFLFYAGIGKLENVIIEALKIKELRDFRDNGNQHIGFYAVENKLHNATKEAIKYPELITTEDAWGYDMFDYAQENNMEEIASKIMEYKETMFQKNKRVSDGKNLSEEIDKNLLVDDSIDEFGDSTTIEDESFSNESK